MRHENEAFLKLKKALLIFFVAAIPMAFLVFPAGLAVLTGCMPAQVHQQPLPQIPDYTKDLYSFPKFELPSAKKPGSVGLSVISIVPEYKDTRNRESTESGEKVTETGAASGSMTRDMAKVFRSFAGSAGEDIEAMLLAKGLTAKGPFVLDEVTFPDKKGADLTVLMQFIFDIQYSEEKFERDQSFDGNKQGKIYSGSMSIGMKVYYYMLEPLSEEKMWVKKLDLGTQDYKYELAREQESYAAGTQFVSDGCGGGHNYTTYAWRDTKKILYDSRPKLFSDQLKEAYPQLMKTGWKYFDADEMLSLRDKSKEIRDRWGSSSYRRGAPQ
jgi:hypothetical protein